MTRRYDTPDGSLLKDFSVLLFLLITREFRVDIEIIYAI